MNRDTAYTPDAKPSTNTTANKIAIWILSFIDIRFWSLKKSETKSAARRSAFPLACLSNLPTLIPRRHTPSLARQIGNNFVTFSRRECEFL
jgi:hypothetical protein